MNTTRRNLIAAVSLCAAAVPGLTVGALIDRGGGLIYDTDLNVTWLSDMNYAMTSGYDADGLMTWHEAMNWAANLSYNDSVRGVIYNDWRLPFTNGNCGGDIFGCPGSEMSYLGGELGGILPQPLSTTHNANFDLFTNLGNYLYWSSVDFPAWDDSAWIYSLEWGHEDWNYKSALGATLAVRDGDVVPSPPTAWLFGSGLLGLIGIARKNVC